MKLVSYRTRKPGPEAIGTKADIRTGAVIEDKVIDLTSRMNGLTVKSLIETDQLQEAKNIAAGTSPDHTLDDVILDLPITDPSKIYCIGINYADRSKEYKDDMEQPAKPSVFVRTPLSFSPHGQSILLPPESRQLDYEGEIVLVIKKQGRRISREHALDHIFGLTIMNEGTIRDWLRHSKFNVTPGKNWDRSGGLGPWIETDFPDLSFEDMRIETRVNGEIRQSDTTASLYFSFARLIEYLSTFGTLLPGDLIATGTPIGAGARFDPPVWLKEGDVVEVEVEGVGTLVNRVEKEV